MPGAIQPRPPESSGGVSGPAKKGPSPTPPELLTLPEKGGKAGKIGDLNGLQIAIEEATGNLPPRALLNAITDLKNNPATFALLQRTLLARVKAGSSVNSEQFDQKMNGLLFEIIQNAMKSE